MIRAVLLISLLGLCSAAGAQAPSVASEPPTHLDSRHGLEQRYVDAGTVIAELPADTLVVPFGEQRYWYHAGVWYQGYGAGYNVVSAPPGIVVPVLPPTYVTLRTDAAIFYYANATYYSYSASSNGYEVISEPAGAESLAGERSEALPTPPLGTNTSFVYPKNGQSSAQQATDRYECHRWARDQTGFDPTRASGGVAPEEAEARRAEYSRAINACLEARGYSVR